MMVNRFGMGKTVTVKRFGRLDGGDASDDRVSNIFEFAPAAILGAPPVPVLILQPPPIFLHTNSEMTSRNVNQASKASFDDRVQDGCSLLAINLVLHASGAPPSFTESPKDSAQRGESTRSHRLDNHTKIILAFTDRHVTLPEFALYRGNGAANDFLIVTKMKSLLFVQSQGASSNPGVTILASGSTRVDVIPGEIGRSDQIVVCPCGGSMVARSNSPVGQN
ncbi:uncharacterized protein BDR25DRAFT_359423 [Lindgomyces ingoldianus]|uniref:Uncharacterized protein n=1 Tax=Lindgomyces ingoldianus TaxID=673940 RepID=A0ACB6QHX2_9PLEO|nr:uncharacterized protein BDR25DRAFT_359423 [Lindgomyces ingoldianus]KAF2466531.1 hypothetical protein BDR25DRAFT_359423 [Lindgomyces ingoldianus]